AVWRGVRGQGGSPAAAARPGRFRRALSTARGPAAGGAANAHVELAIPAPPRACLTAQARPIRPADVGSSFAMTIRLSDRGGKPASLALQALGLRTSK